MQRHYPLNPSTGLEDASLLPWANGNPTTGTEGSYPGFGLFTDSMNEILNAVAGAGLTSGSDLTQLLQAISRGIWLGTFAGSANSLIATIPVTIPALLTGMRLRGIASAANTSTSVGLTLTGDGVSPVTIPIVRPDGTALNLGDIQAGLILALDFDGTSLRLGVSGGASARTRTYFNTVGTTSWVCPATVTRALARVWGGGGGGSGGGNAAGCGGGYSEGWVTVVPGTSYSVVVGGGGGGNGGSGTGGSGATSSFGSFMSATGGQGGSSGPQNPGNGIGGSLNLLGGRGEDLEANNYYAQGGAAPMGGGIGYYQGAMAPGGGGSATSSSAVIGATGSNGADGMIILEY